jgi:SAM-dependent methyltransferase
VSNGSQALACRAKGHSWAVRTGIPRLVPPDLEEIQERTAAAFEFEWTHFTDQHVEFEQQFLDWIYPLGPGDFADKRVLDAGCGTGRHAYFAATYGASMVAALDLSGAVEIAQRVLSPFEHAHVVQGDLLRPPFRTAADGGGFDLVYSIGVLHHLPDPAAGFRSLARLLRPGGTIAVWVYGYENNGFVRHAVEPLRQATTRMSPSALRAVALPLGALFHAAAKGVYRPLQQNRRAAQLLPLHAYLASVGAFSFRQNYAIVYDQLVAPTAAYIRRDQIRRWFEEAGLVDVAISSRHGNSWRGRGRMPA